MFYVILFSCLAVLLVVAGITAISRQRRRWDDAERDETARSEATHRNNKARRAQSRQARRKRH